MMSKTDLRPISQAYWVEPGRFLAGEYPGKYTEELTRRQLDALIQAGFDTFIDLTLEDENVPYTRILLEEANLYERDVQHHRFPIGDFGVPSPPLMNAILNKIEESLAARRKIYLHCWAGIGRTGTTVGCYLVRQGKAGEEALDQLAAWWQSVPKSQYHPHSPETLEQANFIRTWELHDERLQRP